MRKKKKSDRGVAWSLKTFLHVEELAVFGDDLVAMLGVELSLFSGRLKPHRQALGPPHKPLKLTKELRREQDAVSLFCEKLHQLNALAIRQEAEHRFADDFSFSVASVYAHARRQNIVSAVSIQLVREPRSHATTSFQAVRKIRNIE